MDETAPSKIDAAETPLEPSGGAETPKSMNAPSRLFHWPQRFSRWIDQRTGVHEIMKESLDEPIPGGARLAYVFGSGLLFLFISQVITGVCLALYYVPSAETAHTSVAYITKQVAAGAFLRSLHYYGSSAMIIVLALHFLQTFLYGSFKGRRELLWISGAVLSFLVLGMGFTGYLLPWDQKAYFATAVGTNIVGQIPLVGNWLTRLLRGGDTLGTLTLSRFYVAHVFLLPAGIFAFVAAHIFLFRKAGPAGPIHEDPIEPKLAPEGFYPRQVLMDMAFALLIMVGLGILSYFHPASLGPIANPADTQFLPRPEWYYLPMFEWLKFWEGPKVVFAVVVVPGILATLFFLMPFLDRSLERRPWRRPIPVLAVAIVVLGMVYLGMKSHRDDQSHPSIAGQLAIQDQQEKAYTDAPFEPYVESPGGAAPAAVATGPINPLVAQGRGLFEDNGCSGCHGDGGKGAIAVSLVGVTAKYPQTQLIALLHAPNARMRAGHMPAVELSAADMSALVAYLGALGTPAANVPVALGVPPAQPSARGKEPASAAPGKSAGPTSTEGHAAIQPSTADGPQMYRQRGCAGCHGPTGTEGPEASIPPLIAKLSNAQLAHLLQNPNADMKEGGMPPVTGTPEQLNSLIAFLRTLPGSQHGKSSAAEAGNQDVPQPTPPAQNASVASTTPPMPGSATAEANTPASSPAGTGSAAGRALFVNQGCAACHGSAGQGTHFAPSLVGIVSKFPGDKLPALLHNPTKKMRDGGMPAVTINDAEMKQLVSYFSTLSSAPPPSPSAHGGAAQPAPAAAGNPPAPPRAAAPVPLSPLALHGQKVFQDNSCETCHGIGGLHGTVAAPELAGTASILPASILENLLRHHSIKMQQGGMPLTSMNAQDMRALVAYIRSMPQPANGQ